MRRISIKLIRTVLIMPQIVRNLSAQTRKVEKLTSDFTAEFVRKSVRPKTSKTSIRPGLSESSVGSSLWLSPWIDAFGAAHLHLAGSV
jgi:hypothetical protein